jgi:hypothetical protein
LQMKESLKLVIRGRRGGGGQKRTVDNCGDGGRPGNRPPAQQSVFQEHGWSWGGVGGRTSPSHSCSLAASRRNMATTSRQNCGKKG